MNSRAASLVQELESFGNNFQTLQKLFSEAKLILDQIDYNEALSDGKI